LRFSPCPTNHIRQCFPTFCATKKCILYTIIQINTNSNITCNTIKGYIIQPKYRPVLRSYIFDTGITSIELLDQWELTIWEKPCQLTINYAIPTSAGCSITIQALLCYFVQHQICIYNQFWKYILCPLICIFNFEELLFF
jgi:hypothetical protein